MPTTSRSNRRYKIAGLVAAAGVAGWLAVVAAGRRPDDMAGAREALDARAFRTAGAHLEQHLKRHPADADALLLAARAARRNRVYHKATAHLAKYRQAGGSAETAALEDRLARVQRGDLAEADALLAYPDGHPDIFLVLEAVVEGSVAALAAQEAQGQLDPTGPAVARAKRAADRFLAAPLGQADQAQGHFWRGTIHNHAQEHGPAVADLRRAVAEVPDHFEARQALALTIAQANPREALSHLERLIRARPDDFSLRYSEATIRRSLGQSAEARRLLDDLLDDRPQDYQVLLERGLADLDAGLAGSAEAFLRRALAAAPRNPEITMAISRCLRVQGRVAEADDLFAKAQDFEAERTRARNQMRPKN